MKLAFYPVTAVISTFLTDDFGTQAQVVLSGTEADPEFNHIEVSEATFDGVFRFAFEDL